jgi:hypothetical protein
LWWLWLIDSHLLLLKLASRRLGVARECPLGVEHPGTFELPLLYGVS